MNQHEYEHERRPVPAGALLATTYDALEHDGPAVFLAKTTTIATGLLEGVWIDPTAPPDDIEVALTTAGIRPDTYADYSVFDQYQVGGVMVDEDTPPEYLPDLIETLGAVQ